MNPSSCKLLLLASGAAAAEEPPTLLPTVPGSHLRPPPKRNGTINTSRVKTNVSARPKSALGRLQVRRQVWTRTSPRAWTRVGPTLRQTGAVGLVSVQKHTLRFQSGLEAVYLETASPPSRACLKCFGRYQNWHRWRPAAFLKRAGGAAVETNQLKSNQKKTKSLKHARSGTRSHTWKRLMCVGSQTEAPPTDEGRFRSPAGLSSHRPPPWTF